MGYAMSYVFSLTQEEFEHDLYALIWIIIDCLTTLLLFVYINMTSKAMLEGEITRNIASLYFLQRKT